MRQALVHDDGDMVVGGQRRSKRWKVKGSLNGGTHRRGGIGQRFGAASANDAAGVGYLELDAFTAIIQGNPHRQNPR